MSRRAMSLVELLVVLAILGALLALILPATQYAREAARRVQCSSNLRQIALAIHQYEATFHVMPAGNQRGYSYLVVILPYVEQQSLYAKIDWGVYAYQGPSDQIRQHVQLFVCPSDGVAVHSPIAANYSGNMGYDTQGKASTERSTLTVRQKPALRTGRITLPWARSPTGCRRRRASAKSSLVIRHSPRDV